MTLARTTGSGAMRRFRIRVEPFCRPIMCLAAIILVAPVACAAEPAAGRGSRPACPETDNERRTDLHGDPLPDGAVARLGTVRYRAPGQHFLADGRTLLGITTQGLAWLDVTTGRVTRSLDFDADYVSLLAVSPGRATMAVQTHRLPKDEGENDEQVEYHIALLDTSTGVERSHLRLPLSDESPALCAAFHPDGKRLAMGGSDGIIRVWNLETQRREAACAMPSAQMLRGDLNEPVRSVAFSPNGKWLVALSTREAVRWRWQSDARMEPLVERRQSAIAFAPDSGIVAIGGPPLFGADGPGPSIRLFDVEWGRQVGEIFAPRGQAFAHGRIAFTSDGSRLVVPMSAGLSVWNVETGKLERILPLKAMGLQRQPRQAVLSPDDRLVTDGGFPAAVWDFETGQRLGEEFVGHLQNAGIRLSPDGRQVLTIGDEGLAIFWETESGRPLHVWRNTPYEDLPHYGVGFSSVQFSPDGRWIATASQDQDQVVLRDSKSMETVLTLSGHGQGDLELQFTPDGERLLTVGDDSFLRAFDLRTAKAVLEHAIRPTGVRLPIQPDGSVSWQRTVRHGGLSGRVPLILAARFTPDGRTLVLSSWAKVHVFDVPTGKERAHYEVGQDSRRILKRIPEEDGEEDEDAGSAFDEASYLNRLIAVSPDSRHLATVSLREATERSRKYVLHIRRLEDGKVTASFPLPDRSRGVFSPGLAQMAFSPDGSKIATASRSVDVYDIAARRLTARMDQPAVGLAFTPDGERLVTSHANTTALVWDWKRFRIAEEIGSGNTPTR